MKEIFAFYGLKEFHNNGVYLLIIVSSIRFSFKIWTFCYWCYFRTNICGRRKRLRRERESLNFEALPLAASRNAMTRRYLAGEKISNSANLARCYDVCVCEWKQKTIAHLDCLLFEGGGKDVFSSGRNRFDVLNACWLNVSRQTGREEGETKFHGC